MGVLGVILIIICVLLGLIVLAQNPKGGGLAQGFTGAQQIGGVQKTANFLEKGTWTLATLLLALSLGSAAFYGQQAEVTDEFDEKIVAPENFDPANQNLIPEAQTPPPTDAAPEGNP